MRRMAPSFVRRLGLIDQAEGSVAQTVWFVLVIYGAA